MLGGSEELPRPAELEILLRELLSVLHAGEDRKPLPRDLTDSLPEEEDAAAGPLRAADPPTQLMKLRQSESLRMLDHDERGVGNVEPHLDDGGRDQDPGVAGTEPFDGEPALRSLETAVHQHDAGIVKPPHALQRLEHRRRGLEIGGFALLHDRIDHERASTLLHFFSEDAGQGIDAALAKKGGLHGRAAGRALREEREIQIAVEGHRETSRDRRRREHEQVGIPDVARLRGQGDPLANAEPVLLVHHHEPQSVEAKIALQERVRPDDERDRSGGDLGEDLLPLPRGRRGGEKGVAHLRAAQEARRRLRVLLREDGGRGQDRGLGPGPRRAHRGREREHGLPRSHVPQEKPPHRDLAVQIALDRLERLLLRARQAERERGVKPRRQRGARPQGMGRAAAAVPCARVEERDLDPEKLLQREPAPRGLGVFGGGREMDLGEGLRERGEASLRAPGGRDGVGQIARRPQRVLDAGAEPALRHPLREPVHRNHARELRAGIFLLLLGLELGIVHLEPAIGLDRAREEIALPRMKRALDERLIEPHGAHRSGPVLDDGGNVAPPSKAPFQAHRRDAAQHRGFDVGTQECDRRDEPAVAVPPGNVKEKVPKGVDLELGQAAGHLGPHAAHVADRIAKGQHRRGC